MKKVCLVGCGTIGRLHAKNLVGKVELSFHSRTQASAEALSRQCGGGRSSHRTPRSSTAR